MTRGSSERVGRPFFISKAATGGCSAGSGHDQLSRSTTFGENILEVALSEVLLGQPEIALATIAQDLALPPGEPLPAALVPWLAALTLAVLYLLAYKLGMNVRIAAVTADRHWWTPILLVASASYNAILEEDLSMPFAIFNVYQQRIVARLGERRDQLRCLAAWQRIAAQPRIRRCANLLPARARIARTIDGRLPIRRRARPRPVVERVTRGLDGAPTVVSAAPRRTRFSGAKW